MQSVCQLSATQVAACRCKEWMTRGIGLPDICRDMLGFLSIYIELSFSLRCQRVHKSGHIHSGFLAQQLVDPTFRRLSAASEVFPLRIYNARIYSRRICERKTRPETGVYVWPRGGRSLPDATSCFSLLIVLQILEFIAKVGADPTEYGVDDQTPPGAEGYKHDEAVKWVCTCIDRLA